jgi:cytochrome P450
LITLLPCILEKSFGFLGHLNNFAKANQSFPLVHLTGNLTLDIITSVVIDVDFGAQNMDQPSELIRAYQKLFQTYANEKLDLPWYFTPRTEWKRRQLARCVRRTLAAIVREAYANRRDRSVKYRSIKYRSILSLSLQDNADILTTRVVDEACDQISTFLFAGHDTTGILLS